MAVNNNFDFSINNITNIFFPIFVMLQREVIENTRFKG